MGELRLRGTLLFGRHGGGGVVVAVVVVFAAVASSSSPSTTIFVSYLQRWGVNSFTSLTEAGC